MGVEQPLRAMLAPVASARPPAAAFAGCQYFQDDVLLRALKASRAPLPVLARCPALAAFLRPEVPPERAALRRRRGSLPAVGCAGRCCAARPQPVPGWPCPSACCRARAHPCPVSSFWTPCSSGTACRRARSCGTCRPCAPGLTAACCDTRCVGARARARGCACLCFGALADAALHGTPAAGRARDPAAARFCGRRLAPPTARQFACRPASSGAAHTRGLSVTESSSPPGPLRSCLNCALCAPGRAAKLASTSCANLQTCSVPPPGAPLPPPLQVLPPLLQELRDAQLQPTLLPIVLGIVKGQEPGEFVDATLPALRWGATTACPAPQSAGRAAGACRACVAQAGVGLSSPVPPCTPLSSSRQVFECMHLRPTRRRPVLASASGETLLLLVQNAELLAGCMPAAAAAQVLPSLLVRAAQHGERGARPCAGQAACGARQGWPGTPAGVVCGPPFVRCKRVSGGPF